MPKPCNPLYPNWIKPRLIPEARTTVIVYTAEIRSGSARYILEALQAGSELDQRIVLLCPTNFEFREQLSHSGRIHIETTAVKTVQLGTSYVGKLWEYINVFSQALLALRRCANTAGNRTIHFNFPGRLLFAVPLMLASKVFHLGIVFTVHDPVPHREANTPLKAGIERCLMLCACHLADRLIVHNYAGRRQLARALQVSPRRITVIPHGAYNILQVPATVANAGTPLRLLIFGALRQNKGIHLAVEAVQSLNAHDLRVQLLIAGNLENTSERSYWEECKRMIAVHPKGIVIREEYINEHEIASLFAACHLVILPYTRFHSQSGVALMALSNARPVLATRSGGITGLVEASGGGLLLPEANSSAVREGIEEAMTIGALGLGRMGLKGWAFVRKRYSWNVIAEETASVYESVARPCRGGQGARGTGAA